MKIALIYPPTADPTAPYLSVPALTGYLRSKGVDVLPIDANIECYDLLLRSERQRQTARQISRHLARLKKSRFSTTPNRWLVSHCPVHQKLPAVSRITSTTRLLSWVIVPENDFLIPFLYETAVEVLESALERISAAYTPLSLDFSAYRTPFSLLDIREIQKDARPEQIHFMRIFPRIPPEGCFHFSMDKTRTSGVRRFRI